MATPSGKPSYTTPWDTTNLTQSALSRSIQTLESEIGLRLFERGRSGASLTAEGREYLRLGREVHGAALRLERFGNGLASGERGDLTLGLGSSIAHIVLPDLLPRVVEVLPHVSLTVRGGGGHTLIEDVVLGRSDFAIMAQTGAVDPLVRSEHVVSGRSGFFVRQGHPLAAGGMLDRALINGLTLAAGGASVEEMRARFGQDQAVIVCENAESLHMLVRNTDTVWATFAAVAHGMRDRERLVELEWTDASVSLPGTYRVDRFVPVDGRLSRSAERLVSLVEAVLLAKMGGDEPRPVFRTSPPTRSI